jgi:hypothetical protein
MRGSGKYSRRQSRSDAALLVIERTTSPHLHWPHIAHPLNDHHRLRPGGGS